MKTIDTDDANIANQFSELGYEVTVHYTISLPDPTAEQEIAQALSSAAHHKHRYPKGCSISLGAGTPSLSPEAASYDVYLCARKVLRNDMTAIVTRTFLTEQVQKLVSRIQPHSVSPVITRLLDDGALKIVRNGNG